MQIDGDLWPLALSTPERRSSHFQIGGRGGISFREKLDRRVMPSAILLADIGGEDGALLAGHFRDVARRHRIGPCSHTADQADVAVDVLEECIKIVGA